MNRITKTVILLVMVIFSLLIAGCKETKKTEPVTLSSIIITGEKIILETSQETQLSAKAVYTDGTEKAILPLWSVTPEEIAVIDANGKITALKSGSGKINALYEGKIGEKELVINEKKAPFSWNNATVYFVITDRFVNGRTDNDNSYGRVPAGDQSTGTFHGGDLKGLTQKINEGYFNDLGVNAIWITSPLEQIHGWVGGGTSGDFQHYAYHGYYNMDYTEIDANMGTKDELRTFIDTAHKYGIRVIFDVVLNHPGYATLDDMKEFSFGAFKTTVPSPLIKPNSATWHWYHDVYIDYDKGSTKYKTAEWGKWWGKNWVRAGISDYSSGGTGDLLSSLNDLPDFKTESTTEVEIPQFLQNKWGAVKTNAVVNGMTEAKTPRNYLIKWLSDWVREYGVDGFRCDTAKHVEKTAWGELKTKAEAAYAEWKSNNPDKVIQYGAGKFWTTGENFGMGLELTSDYYTTGKFDSMINFAFVNSVNGALSDVSKIDQTYSTYAGALNTIDAKGNVLNYLSSHDTKIFYKDFAKLNVENQKTAGSLLLMAPGAVQIYYGDESGRTSAITCSDPYQYTRSDMNWNSINAEILSHWQKLGRFRAKHLSIGEGSHTKISSAPYIFSRVKGDDRVIIVMKATGDIEVNVNGIFADGDELTDYYSGKKYTAAAGKITISAADNKGTILLEK